MKLRFNLTHVPDMCHSRKFIGKWRVCVLDKKSDFIVTREKRGIKLYCYCENELEM